MLGLKFNMGAIFGLLLALVIVLIICILVAFKVNVIAPFKRIKEKDLNKYYNLQVNEHKKK